jgi:hypothetical protein
MPTSIKDFIAIHEGTIRYNLTLAANGADPEAYKVDYVEGEPGIGKTSAVRQAAARVAADKPFLERIRDGLERLGLYDPKDADDAKAHFKYFVRPMVLAQYEPTDVGGLPWAHDGQMVHLRPAILPKRGLGTLFLDEASKATPKTLNAVGQLLHERQSNGHKLGPAITMALAGNRRQDRSGDNELPRFVWDRVVKYSVEATKEDWISHAMDRGIHPAVIWFVKTSEHFQKFDPAAHKSPTARSWEKASNFLKSGLWKGRHLRDTISGTVGEAAGTQFVAFYSLRDKLQDPEEVLANPHKADVPKDPQAQFAMMSALASVVTGKTMRGFNEYLKRFDTEADNGRESSVFAIQMVRARDNKLFFGDAGIELLERYSEVVFS